ncbi:DUF2341 domain-containing protein [Chitinophaga sp. GCM10012297]|uniref:DUF2341 domain-containing protein n=1 Tax=Chitinophaga chungangae TaxID=2821488 RepID=A0ABS3YAN9_9BACT|nr:DUF2341 domain-containing protein [Chitinophaga chungangae]MBO9151711.1 DUF2341 domain-containing protein [Chitinophaga chungangae]
MKHLPLPLFFCCFFASARAQPAAQWPWSCTVTINTTLSGGNVQGDVDNYPLAVQLNADNFDFSKARANGADVRFSATKNGPFLPHSIEWWDPVNKKALVWVKVPLVKGNTDQQSIFMHWGNERAQAEDHAAEIFSVKEGFTGVWHLNEPGNTLPDGYKDATSNAAHATGVNMRPVCSVDGPLGKAQQFNYQHRQWIKIDNEKRKLFDLTQHLTFSIWALAESYPNKGDENKRVLPGYETMFAKGDNSWRLQKFGIRNWHQPEAELIEVCVESASPRGDLCVAGRTDMKTRQWYHITGVHDYPYVKLYVNGVLDKTEKFDTEWKTDDHPVGIGNQSQFPEKGGRNWDGVLDEARVLSVSKNEYWIKLDYESQRPGSRLLRFGKAEKKTF